MPLHGRLQKGPPVGWKSKKSKKYDKKDSKDDEDDDDMSISSDDDVSAKKKKPYPKVKESLVCFVGTPSAKADKVEMHELNATMPDIPQYLNWSEATITWDRSDHPDHVPHPGKYALVVDSIVDNFRLTKVLMDGGNSLIILYYDTLCRMN